MAQNEFPTMHGPWETLTAEVVHDTPWIRVSHHHVVDPGGNNGSYSIIHFKSLAIGIVPLDQDMNTWIVGQYRYPIKKYSWEIPEGGGDKNIDPILSAKRELLEETGIKAAKWDKVLEMDLSNSASDEEALIYIARDLTFFEAQPDENEELEQRKLPFSELYNMVVKGEVRDSLTVAAVMKIQLMILNNEL